MKRFTKVALIIAAVVGSTAVIPKLPVTACIMLLIGIINNNERKEFSPFAMIICLFEKSALNI